MNRRLLAARVGVGLAVAGASLAAAIGPLSTSNSGGINSYVGQSTVPGSAFTCDRNATTATFAAQISAATAGQTVCLTQSADYGTFDGTNKAITIAPADGVSPTMDLNLGSGDSGFTIDGRRNTWDDTTGLSLNNAGFSTGVHDVTFKNFWATGCNEAGNGCRLWDFDPGPTCNSNITIDHAQFYDVGNFQDADANAGPEAAIYVEDADAEPCDTGITVENSLFRHLSADGFKLVNDSIVTIRNNKFLDSHECLEYGCSGNHTDAIQAWTGDGSVIEGNWVDDCDQAIDGFNGTSNMLVEHNLITGCFTYQIAFFGDAPGSTVRWNTVANWTGSGSYECPMGLDGEGPSTPAISNNIFQSIDLSGSCAPTSNTHNLLASGGSSPNISGSPTFVGGSTPTTYAGYCLTAGSSGHHGATDGTDVGICGGDYNAATTGPPTGEGY